MEKQQKIFTVDNKKMLFSVAVGVGVAIIMVSIFGKLAPIAIVSCKLVSSLVRPFFG